MKKASCDSLLDELDFKDVKKQLDEKDAISLNKKKALKDKPYEKITDDDFSDFFEQFTSKENSS